MRRSNDASVNGPLFDAYMIGGGTRSTFFGRAKSEKTPPFTRRSNRQRESVPTRRKKLRQLYKTGETPGSEKDILRRFFSPAEPHPWPKLLRKKKTRKFPPPQAIRNTGLVGSAAMPRGVFSRSTQKRRTARTKEAVPQSHPFIQGKRPALSHHWPQRKRSASSRQAQSPKLAIMNSK